jgi:hypothetical protein
MKLRNNIKNLLFYVLLCVISTHAWAQQINVNQTQIAINNDLKFNSVKLPRHDFAYDLQLPSEETSDKPVKGAVPPYSSTIMKFYRNDSKNNIATLKITDPAIGNVTIWEGIITYDPNFQQLTYKTLQQAKELYFISISTSKLDNAISQFKIDIIC